MDLERAYEYMTPEDRRMVRTRVEAYPRLVATMKRCIAGMPHCVPQEAAIELLRELGEMTPKFRTGTE